MKHTVTSNGFLRGQLLPILTKFLSAAVFLAGLVALAQTVVNHRSHGGLLEFLLAACLLIISVQFVELRRVTRQPRDQDLNRLKHLETIRDLVRAFAEPSFTLGSSWDKMDDRELRSRVQQFTNLLEQSASWCPLPLTCSIPDRLRARDIDEELLVNAEAELTAEIEKLLPARWGFNRGI
jgi:hypothetical protein